MTDDQYDPEELCHLVRSCVCLFKDQYIGGSEAFKIISRLGQQCSGENQRLGPMVRKAQELLEECGTLPLGKARTILIDKFLSSEHAQER